MDKKTLLLCCFTTLFLVSCGGDPQRSAYVSDCLGETPGGSSFKELCECSYDKGVESLTSDELKAFKRDFSEVEDMQ